jgi:hypothetical protein
MFTVLFTVVVVVLVAFGLWWAQRGEGSTVIGQGNAFEAYYGKGRFDPGKSPPCAECVTRGCIGAGECFCPCHRASKKKK